MIVSKVNLISTNYNKRVSTFKGDTLSDKNQENTPSKKERLDAPTKFLIGSLVGGSALVGLIFAGKKGMLGKSVKGFLKGAADIPQNSASSSMTYTKPEPVIKEEVETIVKNLTVEPEQVAKSTFIKEDYVPETPYVVPKGIDKTKGHGYIAGEFTNMENKVTNSPPGKQVERFEKNLLSIIEDFTPEELKGHILFRPGLYALEKNPEIAKKAIEIAKAHPDYAPVIVNNLLSYDMPSDFSKTLAYRNFDCSGDGNLAWERNRHISNLNDIRILLKKSGLPCDDIARLKARADWYDNVSVPQPFLREEEFSNTMLLDIFKSEKDLLPADNAKFPVYSPNVKKLSFSPAIKQENIEKTEVPLVKLLSPDKDFIKTLAESFPGESLWYTRAAKHTSWIDTVLGKLFLPYRKNKLSPSKYHTPNTYMIAFKPGQDKDGQYLAMFKRAAFDYDMSLGIDRKTADEMIEYISEGKPKKKALKPEDIQKQLDRNLRNYLAMGVDRKTAEERILVDKSVLVGTKPRPLPIEKDLGLKLNTIIKKINDAVVDK